MKRPSALIILVLAFIIICLCIAISIPPTNLPNKTASPQRQSKERPATGSQQSTGFCLAGCPRGASEHDVVITHHIFELSNNPDTKFADWVAYQITATTLGSGCKRIWKADPELDPDTTLRPSDYAGMREALASDRGHQAPLASLCGSPFWEEADYLSNITPQKSDLNEGPWEHLEEHERALIKQGVAGEVYTLTGPLYEREMPMLPRAHVSHKVPSGYWKIISTRRGESIEAAAFIMDQNSHREDDYCNDVVAIDAIERRTHLEFFPDLNKERRAALIHGKDGEELIRALGC